MKLTVCFWALALSCIHLCSAEIEMGVKPGLKFDLPGFHVQPGEEVKLTFSNNDEMMHNVLFTVPGKRLHVVEAAIALGADGFAKHFVPEIPEVLSATPIVQPGEKFVLKFTAPEQPAKYPYVCTFPGHGYVMHGVMFVAKERPPELDQLLKSRTEETTSQVTEIPLSKAKLMRTFMPESSPAAIAVALPGGHSYCWDAGNCRLRYVWRGNFIQRNGSYGRWRILPTILGQVYYREPKLPFRIKGDCDEPTVKFLGYRFIDGIPEFRYKLGQAEVREFLAKLPGQSGLVRRFQIQGLKQGLEFHKDVLSGVDFQSDKGKWTDHVLHLSPKEAESFTLIMIEIPEKAPIEYWSMDDLSRKYPKKGSLVEGHKGRAWKFGNSLSINTDYEFSQFQDEFAVSFWAQTDHPEGSIPSFFGWGEPGQGPNLSYQGKGAGLQMGVPANIALSSGDRLEAENAKLVGAPTTNKNPGHSGSGYVDFGAKSGESIEWNTKVEDEGKYLLRFRYALPGGARPLKVELNGKTIAERGDFADSGHWENWKDADFPVTLQKGNQTIKISSIGYSGPNIDFLSLVYLDKKKDSKKPKPPEVPKPLSPDHLLSKGEWHHVLVNFENSKTTLHVNGKLIESKELETNKFQPKARFHLGSKATGKPYLMDEVRLYSRSLNNTEIEELFKR